MKINAKPIDISNLKHQLRVIVVKDLFDFWILLVGAHIALKFKEEAAKDGTNYYDWPRGSEHGVLKLAKVSFNRGYMYPQDREELFAAAEAEADKFRKALGLEPDITYAEGI